MSENLRAANAANAAHYDLMPFEMAPNVRLAPDYLAGLAALYDVPHALTDVLDIGCGTGVELERLGPIAPGRLVGVDLSADACDQARARCAPFGDRVRIDHADFLDLDAGKLGQFDLILHIGCLYVVPPEVRRHVLDLIGRCLKPGGLAVISYYAGSVAALRVNLHRTLSAGLDLHAEPKSLITEARRRLEVIKAAVSEDARGYLLLAQALKETSDQPDAILYHEVFTPDFSTLQTTALEAALAPHGVSFLTYTVPGPWSYLPAAIDRALTADANDFAQGEYRYALFARASGEMTPDLSRPAVRWSTPLRRLELGAYDTEAEFVYPAANIRLILKYALTQALVEVLAEAPARWDEALSAAHARLNAQDLTAGKAEEELALKDLGILWGMHLARPLGG